MALQSKVLDEYYRCPACYKEHLTWDEANDCCEPILVYGCTECATTYEDEDKARECCGAE